MICVTRDRPPRRQEKQATTNFAKNAEGNQRQNTQRTRERMLRRTDRPWGTDEPS
jgi:hypothetical protein